MERSHLSEPTGEYYLWWLMIASDHQGRGYGRRAVELLIRELQGKGVTMLLVSCGTGDGSPRDFYRKLGFEETGEVMDGEIVLRLPLTGRGESEEAANTASTATAKP